MRFLLVIRSEGALPLASSTVSFTEWHNKEEILQEPWRHAALIINIISTVTTTSTWHTISTIPAAAGPHHLGHFLPSTFSIPTTTALSPLHLHHLHCYFCSHRDHRSLCHHDCHLHHHHHQCCDHLHLYH